jgi:methionyl-tRNA formyltransferase
VTYAHKITKEECTINWEKPAAAVLHHIHGLSPYPAASFEYQGERVKVLKAVLDSRLRGNDVGAVIDDSLTITCGDGNCIRPTLVQRAGKKPMSTEEMLRGFVIPAGTVLKSQ